MSTGALMDVPMPLHQLVYLTFLSTAVCSLPETIQEGLPYNLQMDSHNFQHILTWQAQRDPAVPASYNVLYRDYRWQHWRIPQHCSGIAQLSCELTEQFHDRGTEYSVFVQSIAGAQVLNSSLLIFSPITQTILGPPEVNVTSCPSCLNVTIKVPTSHFRDQGKLVSLIEIYHELDYDITLKSQEGEHKRPRQRSTAEVFSAVIEELYPGRNYCVSVTVSASLNKHSLPSPWKCDTAASEARAEYHEVAVAGAVCVSLIIFGVLKCVHSTGFILPKISLPQTLACIRKLAYSPWVSELEKVASVEIIPREVKSKARGRRGSDSSDSSDSDSDSSAPSDHNYTRRPGRASAGRASPQSLGQRSGGCEHSGQPGQQPAAGPQQQRGHPAGDSPSDVPSPGPEGGCEPPGSSECFTISLHTVLLGAPGHGGLGSAAAPPARDAAGDWLCAPALEAELQGDTVQGAPGSGDFPEWQNSSSSSSSEESDSLDSDTEHLTGYMRR